MSKPPVFVIGSARSGTTLLYHTLLSSGGFAVYRTEPAVFDLLAPKFGSLDKLRNRKRLLNVWLRSHQFRLSGLDPDILRNQVLNECRNYGDFLQIIMNGVARQQNMERWAVWGPDNLLHIPAIARDVPNALFIHMIRDGRDVALSLSKEGWIHSFPWDSDRRLLTAALHWKWKVSRGRHDGQNFPSRYLEVHFEDLVTQPQETLAVIGRFIDHEINTATVQDTAVGTLSAPNSTFRNEVAPFRSSPVGRWKSHLSPPALTSVESAIGDLLRELGYSLRAEASVNPSLLERSRRALYPHFFTAKEWLRTQTPMGRLVNTSRLRFEDDLGTRPVGKATGAEGH